MTAQIQTVLWIAGVGGVLLFAAIAGLVLLMYVLTSPFLSLKRTRAAAIGVAADEPASEAHETQELERRRRAAALAVAVAVAEADRSPVFSADDSANWRLLHRSARLRQQVVKRGAGR
jgi:Na+-transporting methylmalonyl-CoA/oxaloacetate decarboxylase gamma subunit